MNTQAQDQPEPMRRGRARKLTILAGLLMAIGVAFYLKGEANTQASTASTPAGADGTPAVAVETQTALPKLIDLGADKCIPCKAMAPILADLKASLQGQVDVEFIDVWKNPEAGEKYGVQIIPTQIFYDAAGQERFRHEGFFAREDILAQWAALGVKLNVAEQTAPAFSRWEPATPDRRPKESVCYLCDGDIEPKTRTVMKTPAGEVGFCSPHCYLITFASLTDAAKSHDSVSVTDWATGALVPVVAAVYLQGLDARGRPAIRAFADDASAKAGQQSSGGNVLSWASFQEKEMAARCGFCDRPVYAEDACIVRVQGMQTWGCCTMCALGVAARTGQDIVVEAKDALSGDKLQVTTLAGHVAELIPPAMVAWAGAKKDADGKTVSTGCFKQAFFSNEANLKAWVEAHPAATGRMITIEQALQEKMKLTPQQISKACKIGECTPK